MKASAPQLFDHPAAWRGDELLARPDWRRELSPGDIEDILAGRRCILLADVQDALENGSGGTLIRGFPSGVHSEEACRDFFLKVASQIGTPVSQSATGEILFSVRDAGFKDDDPRTRGPNTSKKLSYHTDRCDVIGFLCLKQAKSGGENDVVSSVALYNEILERRPDLLEVLTEPFYYKRHNVDTGNELTHCQQPIFSIYQDHFAANILRVLIERAYSSPEFPDMTPIQQEALDFVETVANEPGFAARFRQEPGDMVFLNNFVTFHRRSEFEDHEDPREKRHLLRVWLSVPNSRPLHPDFAGNYGDTAAGAIRGGMKPQT